MATMASKGAASGLEDIYGSSPEGDTRCTSQFSGDSAHRAEWFIGRHSRTPDISG